MKNNLYGDMLFSCLHDMIKRLRLRLKPKSNHQNTEIKTNKRVL